MPTKIRYLQVKSFKDDDLDGLLSSFREWAGNREEEDLLGREYRIESGTHVLLIFYTE